MNWHMLATLVGMVASIVGGVWVIEHRFEKRLDKVEHRFEQGLGEVEHRFEKRLDRVEQSLRKEMTDIRHLIIKYIAKQ